MKQNLTPVLFILGAVFATGCGSPSKPVGERGPADTATAASTDGGSEAAKVSCATLLPEGELHAILGVAPIHAIENTYPGATDCSWKFTAPGTVQETFFQIVTSATGGDQSLWLGMRDAEAREDSKTPVATPGIGDEAYLWVGRGDYRKLYVRRGNSTLIVRGPVALPVLATDAAMADLAARLFARF